MNKEILRLAIPNIISNISVPLLSTVDTALMGRLSEVHIGAVGVGAMIFNFIYWNFGFLRMGTTGITAQAYGKQDEALVITTLGRAMVVVLVVAASLMVLQYPLGELSFYLMNIDVGQLQLVAEYFYIRIWAAPASLALFAFMGWFFGMQNAIYPLILTIFINVINIVCSFFFVRSWGMEADGVALGTVIAQYAGLLLAVGLFYHRYRYLLPKLQRAVVLQWTALQRFLSLNFDIFIRTFCLTFAFGFFYSQSASLGELVLASNVILLQYLNWMSYGVDGFAFAAEALVGKYAGASDDSQTKRAIRVAFVWGMGMAVFFSFLFWLFGVPLLHVFTNQADVIAITLPFLFWMVLFPIASTPCYIWDGVFIGLTAARSMRNAMALAIIVYLAPFFYLKSAFGNHGLWLALLLFMLARAGFQWLWYWRKGLALD
ncbi:MAG: MATE family efflux transporter [Bacteroidota bacterium]